MLPRWGKCRSTSRKSLKRSTFRCFKIIMPLHSIYFTRVTGDLIEISARNMLLATPILPLAFERIHRRQEFFFCNAQSLLLLLVLSCRDPFIGQADQLLTWREALARLGGSVGLSGEQCEPAIIDAQREAVLFAITTELVEVELVILSARQRSLK